MSAALTRGTDATDDAPPAAPARTAAGAPRPRAGIDVRAITGIAWADWLERVRTTRFLVTLGAMLALGWYFLPPNGANYATMQIGGHRGVYNSAWIAALVGLLANTFLSLIGFYLVKNGIRRDRATGVGQILAAAPLTTRDYLLGKWLSNCGVLFTMIAALTVSAGVMQAVRAESPVFNPVTLILTMSLLTLPVMAVVAAIAVLFETTPGLRGSLGNVVFFFLWITFLSLSAVERKDDRFSTDFIGAGTVIPSMKQACIDAFPGTPDASMSLGVNIKSKGEHWELETFEWKGMTWSAPLVGSRLLWLLPALLAIGLGTRWFDRFDTAPSMPGARWRPFAPRGAPDAANGNGLALANGRASGAAAFLSAAPTRHLHRSVASLAPARSGPAFLVLLRAEFALLVRGNGWWWYALVGLFAILCTFVPYGAARFPLLPIMWAFLMLRWSPLGTRERAFDTAPVLFSAPSPVLRQLAASWLAGAALALLPSLGILIRIALSGDAAGVAGVLAGAAFVPALALASGIWTGSTKLFEVTFLVLWYALLNHAVALDFVGAIAQPVTAAPLRFATIAAMLLVLATLGRARQVRG